MQISQITQISYATAAVISRICYNHLIHQLSLHRFN